jgi:hypothetical protein
MSESRLALAGAANRGRDIYRTIRESIYDCRRRGIEPAVVWVGKDTIDAMHALWSAVAQSYDLKLPLGVAGVPMHHGAGLGRNKFVFEYHTDGAVNAAALKPATDNPLPDND